MKDQRLLASTLHVWVSLVKTLIPTEGSMGRCVRLCISVVIYSLSMTILHLSHVKTHVKPSAGAIPLNTVFSTFIKWLAVVCSYCTSVIDEWQCLITIRSLQWKDIISLTSWNGKKRLRYSLRGLLSLTLQPSCTTPKVSQCCAHSLQWLHLTQPRIRLARNCMVAATLSKDQQSWGVPAEVSSPL